MKVVNRYRGIVRFIILAMFAITISCSEQRKPQAAKSDKIISPTEVILESHPALQLPNGKSDMIKVDMRVWYESELRRYGIDDFSTSPLIGLMDSQIPSVRNLSALLLGTRKEKSAIPRLEKALSDELIPVQIGVTMALLQMDNRKGIKVLLDFCEKASKEFEQGNYENTSYMSMAINLVLADAGEISAIPYLRQLLGYKDSWGVRLNAVRSLSKLYKKEPAVIKDIASMMEDEHPQVRREASEILHSIHSKQDDATDKKVNTRSK